MRGSNTLKINQATMKEAIACWLETQFVKPPRVKEVMKDSGGYGACDTFIIEIESDEEDGDE